MGLFINLSKILEGKDINSFQTLPEQFTGNMNEQSSPTLPAEWALQSGVQLTWPHKDTDWASMLDEVQACFIEIAREIAKREILLIVTPYPEEVRLQIQGKVNIENVRFFKCLTNDTWARDHGAITLLDAKSPIILDFCFNGWGNKFEAQNDNAITTRLYQAGLLKAAYQNHLHFVLEGGSIECDGQGTLLTTSACLLNPNRNPRMNKVEIENFLLSVFHLRRILWLDYGFLQGDDTDSHIDTLARFCSPNTIAYVKCTDETDEHFIELNKMEEQLKSFLTPNGYPYQLVPLPMPDKVVVNGERLPATYANFLILNDAVLYPTYNQPLNDVKAKDILQDLFPSKEVIGIDCRTLIKQHGSLHCVTMQYPLRVLT